MDFRTCPACTASVLEDDVEECPFCGASMSGKPAPKPAATRPAPGAKPGPTGTGGAAAGARPGTPAGRPAAAAPGAASRPAAAPAKPPLKGATYRGSNTVADEENPFDMDLSALKSAAPVSPKPTKTRTLEVKCPMCETVGYVLPAQQGKDVKCSNPACKHPFFQVPRPRKETERESYVPPKRMKVSTLLTLVVLGLSAAGGSLYWFVIRQEDPIAQTPTYVPPRDGGGTTTPEVVEPVAPKVVRTSIKEIESAAMKDLVRIAQARDTNQTIATRYLTEAYAVTGDFKKTENELNRLVQTARDASFFQIEPLVQLYLQQKRSGKADAGRILDTALAATDRLPQSSRNPIDAATALTAALILEGRQDEANKLFDSLDVEESRGDYSMLWTAAVYGEVYNFQTLSDIPAWIAAPNPQRCAVTWLLASWGDYDKALQWAKAGRSVDVVDSCIAVWAARIAFDTKNPADGEARVEAGLAGSSKAGTARAWANFGYQMAVAGNKAAAESAIAKADEALSTLEVPAPMEMPSVRAIFEARSQERAGLPDSTRFRSSALAAANLAAAHLQIGDQKSVEALVLKALEFSEGMAPPASLVDAQVADADANRTRGEARLRTEAGLKPTDNIFTLFNAYKAALRKVQVEANKRITFEREMLRDIAYRGQAALVWSILQQRDQVEPATRRQNYLQTTLPVYIAYLAAAAGDVETGNSIGKAGARKDPDLIDRAAVRLVAQFKTGNFGPVIEELQKLYRAGTVSRDRLDINILRRLAQYHTTQGPEKAFQLIRQLPDPQLQDAAMWLLAARSVVDDQAPELWKLTSPPVVQRSMTVMEQASLARGYVAGARTLARKPAGEKKTAEPAQ